MATGRFVPRTVNVRPGYYVPGLPPDLLESVRGADSRVEFAVLTAEYWTQPGISPFLAHGELLKTLPEYLDAHNIDAFVRLLSRRRHAEGFFNLLRDDVDRREELRRYLQTLGLFEDTYLQYATFATNPKLLLDGFLYGVGESFTAIVKDLPEMAKLLGQAVEEWRLLFVLSVVSPSAAEVRVGSHIAAVMLVWDGVKDKLNPAHLPAAAWDQFNTWKKQFGDHLAHLRPFQAGRTLGKAGGDLYQLLTGVLGMARLLRVSGKVAIQYAPLLLTSVRDLAKRGSTTVVTLARFLGVLGPKTLQALPRVGMATLTTLFPPDALKRVLKGASAIYSELGDLSVCAVSEPALAMAGGGSLDGGLALMVMHQQKPIALATTTKFLPSAQVVEEVAAAAKSLDAPTPWTATGEEVDNFLNAVFDELSTQGKGPRLVDATEAAVLAARWAQMTQRLEWQFGGFIRAQAIRTFLRMKSQKGYVLPHLLGLGAHSGAAKDLTGFVAKIAPNVRPIVEATTRQTLTVLAGMDARLAPMAAKIDKLCSEPVVDFLYRRKDLLKVYRIEGADQATVTKFAKQWKYDASTVKGNLRSDAVLVDTDLGTVRNLDWTSSTMSDRYERTWRAIADAWGPSAPKGITPDEAASVDWQAIANKYRATYSREGLPENITKAIDDLSELQAHALRETVLRKAILEEALEHVQWSWHVSSQEILYPSVDELRKLLK